jgi:hypothetical protein
MGLNPIGTTSVNGGKAATILYSVSGLPKNERALVGYMGYGYDGKRKWRLAWFKHYELVTAPRGPFDSPQEALQAFGDMRN